MKSCSMTGCAQSLAIKAISILDFLSPLIDLTLRLWMADVFWKSGVIKFNNWQSTIYLFTYEFPVPLLPVHVAAMLGTTFELLCPILLTLGLATRLATLPLLAMTALIEFTFDNNIQHYYWAMLLGVILLHGPGKLSLDYLIKRRFGSLPRKR
ncbi:MAG: DoxX family protein [Pseudomonadota bacterium]|nr:DoxX family protein [Pseudomonadota bacterium]